MTKIEVLEALNNIFVETLGNEEISLSEESTAEQVEGWDSLTHVLLVVEIEKYFNIRFTSMEIQSWRNVGELLNNIASKTA